MEIFVPHAPCSLLPSWKIIRCHPNRRGRFPFHDGECYVYILLRHCSFFLQFEKQKNCSVEFTKTHDSRFLMLLLIIFYLSTLGGGLKSRKKSRLQANQYTFSFSNAEKSFLRAQCFVSDSIRKLIKSSFVYGKHHPTGLFCFCRFNDLISEHMVSFGSSNLSCRWSCPITCNVQRSHILTRDFDTVLCYHYSSHLPVPHMVKRFKSTQKNCALYFVSSSNLTSSSLFV